MESGVRICSRGAVATLAAGVLFSGCAEDQTCVEAAARKEAAGEHMAAQATLAAHFVDAALQAGRTAGEINQALQGVVRSTAIDEFWISDETGQVVFSSHPDVVFFFPTDVDAGTQAAPFAALLNGTETKVVQEPMPRDLDGEVFRYVGVGGVDRPRIVQLGMRDDTPAQCGEA